MRAIAVRFVSFLLIASSAAAGAIAPVEIRPPVELIGFDVR